MSEHTPTPWKLDDGSIMTEAGQIIADLWNPGARNPQGNGEFIVLACNQHDELVAALKAYRLAQGRMLDRWSDADQALKKELWSNLHACEDAAMAVLAKVREKGD